MSCYKFCVSALIILVIIIFISCSDNTPTKSNDNNITPADSSDHMITNVLTFYGGLEWDWGTSIASTTDGGFIITGSTDSYGEGKNTLYLVKADSIGKAEWDTIFGGSGEDNGEAVALAPDGGYIIAGVTSSFNANYDFYLLKVNIDGSLAWEKSIGTTDFEWGTDLAVLDDGYAVCGYMIPDGAGDGGNFYLVRTDLSGNVIWSKTFNRSNREWPFAMTTTSDGGFILAGYVHYAGSSNLDAFLIKTYDTGKVIWEETYGGSGDEHLFSILETSGGFVALGSSRSFGGSNAELPYLFKVNNHGILQWEKYYGTTGNYHGRELIENSDGSFVFTGLINFEGSGTDLAKTDASGNLLWSESIGLSGAGMSIIRTADGSYAVTGFARDSINSGECDMLLMKVVER